MVEEAAAGGYELIVSHHPVIFSPLKKLTPRDVSFQLVQKGISAICMHTNLDAAEGGVNEVLAGIFGMQDWEVFADGYGRVGEVDPITVPELARKAQAVLGGRCNRCLLYTSNTIIMIHRTAAGIQVWKCKNFRRKFCYFVKKIIF